MEKVLKKIELYGIVPVISIDDADHALPLAKALLKGGLPVAEVTFRTDEGEESIARISKELPDVLVGAGTVLTCGQVDRAVAAGAQFIMSPGFNPEVVRHCIEIGIPVIPGVCTPGEMEQAIALGLSVVKFFPAEQKGGIAFIKAVSAPYPMLRFIPTGGISTVNLCEYLHFPKVLACGGSWMVKPEWISGENFTEITCATSEAVKLMLGFEPASVAINCNDEKQARNTAELLCSLFGFPVREDGLSVFAGPIFEYMKTPAYGKNGIIRIKTNSAPRAIHYFERRGIALNHDSREMNAIGTVNSIFFRDEICGFVVCLTEK